MDKENIEEILKEFAELIAEEVQIPQEAEEPFDQYQHRIKAKIYSESNHFRERFVNGYKAIAQELGKDS